MSTGKETIQSDDITSEGVVPSQSGEGDLKTPTPALSEVQLPPAIQNHLAQKPEPDAGQENLSQAAPSSSDAENSLQKGRATDDRQALLASFPRRGVKTSAGELSPVRPHVPGGILSVWLLNGYRSLPFGITSVLLAALLFWAIVVSGWVVVPFPPFQWFVQSTLDRVSGSGSNDVSVVLQPVWYTGQAVLAVGVGAMMGPRWALLLYGIYLVIGVAGVPWFAEGGGPGYLLRPNMGYLLGLCLASVVSGLVFNMAYVAQQPRTPKARKLRRRAQQQLRYGRPRRLQNRWDGLIRFIRPMVQWFRPHPKKRTQWVRWMIRSVGMGVLCVSVVHGVGALWLGVTHAAGLSRSAESMQRLFELTTSVWPYDVVGVSLLIVCVLLLKAVLNPIYRKTPSKTYNRVNIPVE